jgi:hypothetical protein
MLKLGFVKVVMLVALMSLCGVATFAVGATSSSLFQQGQQAFKAGQRGKALSLFKQAEAKGMNKASLYYNIGVCSYSLGEYEQSKKAFNKVIDLNKDMAPLAHYNLGLIAMKEGNRGEMISGFETAMTTSTDSKIRDMAAAALDENEVVAGESSSPYMGYFEVSVGYDDNIELYSGLLGSKDDGDWFTEFFAAATMPIKGGTYKKGTQLFGSVYYQKYADYSEYDLGTADVGVQYLFTYRGWQLKPAVDYAYTIQDVKSYDQTPTFSLQGRHSFYWDTEIRLTYRLSYIDILDSDYDAIEGTRNKFRAEVIKKWQKTSVSLKYTLELNDRDNDDLSPTRNTIAVKVRHRFNDRFSGTGIVSFRNSSYDNTAAYDRDEDRWKTTLRGSYVLTPIWNLTADYTYSDNEDSPEYDRYNYTRNVGALRLERSF